MECACRDCLTEVESDDRDPLCTRTDGLCAGCKDDGCSKAEETVQGEPCKQPGIYD